MNLLHEQIYCLIVIKILWEIVYISKIKTFYANVKTNMYVHVYLNSSYGQLISQPKSYQNTYLLHTFFGLLFVDGWFTICWGHLVESIQMIRML